MVRLKIAILEDNLERIQRMRLRLSDRFPQYELVVFSGFAQEMVSWLGKHLAETLVISLDHDFELVPDAEGKWVDPGTGRDVVDALCNLSACCPVVIHSSNTPAALGMEAALQEQGWQVTRVSPYEDLSWIDQAWFPAVRAAIVGQCSELAPSSSVLPRRASS